MNNFKYCNFCGATIDRGAQFCNNCGASLTKVDVNQSTVVQTDMTQTQMVQQPTTMYNATEQGKKDKLGLLSLIFGIASIIILPFLCVPAIILGHIDRKRTKSQLGLAGLILGYIALAGLIALYLWLFVIFLWYW